MIHMNSMKVEGDALMNGRNQENHTDLFILGICNLVTNWLEQA
jgi:hypothetical protein